MAAEKSCRGCNSCGMDMDLEPYCVEPTVHLKRTKITGRQYPYGLAVNPAWELCQGDQWTERKAVA